MLRGRIKSILLRHSSLILNWLWSLNIVISFLEGQVPTKNKKKVSFFCFDTDGSLLHEFICERKNSSIKSTMFAKLFGVEAPLSSQKFYTSLLKGSCMATGPEYCFHFWELRGESGVCIDRISSLMFTEMWRLSSNVLRQRGQEKHELVGKQKKINGVLIFPCLSSLCFLYMDLKVKTGRMDCTLKPGLHSCYAIKKIEWVLAGLTWGMLSGQSGPASPRCQVTSSCQLPRIPGHSRSRGRWGFPGYPCQGICDTRPPHAELSVLASDWSILPPLGLRLVLSEAVHVCGARKISSVSPTGVICIF